MSKTPSQLIKLISKDLNQLTKQAEQYNKQTCDIVEREHKSKLLAKRKYKYSLNPHRIERLYPEKVKDKSLRKQAREIERRLAVALDNLLVNKSQVVRGAQEVKHQAQMVILSLQRLDEALQELPKWLQYTEDQSKLLRYERRNELSLSEKIFGTMAPSEVASKEVGAEGVIAMANKKESVKGLLDQLKKATDQAQKRVLRSKLRKLGHKGGLGEKIAEPSKKAKKVKKAKKTIENEETTS